MDKGSANRRRVIKRQRQGQRRDLERRVEQLSVPDEVEKLSHGARVPSQSRRARPWNLAAAALFGLISSGSVFAEEPTGIDSVVESEQDPEAGLIEAFRSVREQSNDPELLRSMSAENLEKVVKMIEGFPVRVVAEKVAELTGLSSEELLESSTLEHVFLYNSTILNQREEEIRASHPDARLADEMVEAWYKGAAFTSPNGKYIGINIEVLASFRDEQIKPAVAEVVLHEFFHTYPSDSFIGEGTTDLNLLVYEGLDQALAITVLRMLNSKTELVDTGYQTGIKQAGYLIVEVVGQQEVFKNFLTDNLGGISEQWDEKFGEGSWERAMNFKLDIQGEEVSRAEFKDIYPLYALLKETEPNVLSHYLSTNGAMPTGDMIPLFFESGELKGVYVRDDRLSGEKIPAGIAVVPYQMPDGSTHTFVMLHPARPEIKSLAAGEGMTVSGIESPPTRFNSPLIMSTGYREGRSDGAVRRSIEASLEKKIAEELVRMGVIIDAAETNGDSGAINSDIELQEY